jgi:hypothetical protein
MENQSITKKCPFCQENISSSATKCPYCGKNFRSWFGRHPVLTIIIALLILPPFLSGIFSSSKKPSSSSKEPEQANETKQQETTEVEKKQSEEERQIKINNLADKFCENRQGEYAYGVFFCSGCVDLNEVIEGLDTIHNAKSPATQENCQKISNYCLYLWNENECQKIAEQKIWIGMSKDQLLLSWGVPKDTNNTVGSWGVHSQWVYGDLGPYVYLEGDNKRMLTVTSWQN